MTDRSQRCRAAALTLLLASAPLSAADADPSNTAADRLAALLVPVKHLKAEFTQTVLGPQRELVQSSEGYLRIARPQQFKWVLVSPYPQTIVTVDDRLYIYDPDLQQVQVKQLAAALTGTPALVLLGTPREIDAQFNVTEQTTDGVAEFALVPKDPDALYTEIRMTFSAKSLTRIEILDSLGQLTDVNFHNLEINGPQLPDEFEFAIPPDADVIGDGAPKPA